MSQSYAYGKPQAGTHCEITFGNSVQQTLIGNQRFILKVSSMFMFNNLDV